MKPKTTTWRPFSEARVFVHQLGLKSKDEWKEYCKSDKRPPDIPSNPNQVYISEFKGFGDWLGTGTIATFRRSYRPFAEARAFVHTLGLKNSAQWYAYCRSGKKPTDIPAYPGEVDAYHSEYKDMGDWLGTGNVAPTKRAWRPFAEARSYVRGLKLKNQDAWLVYCKSGQKPADIPSNPASTYLDEFESFGDWLGNDNIHRGKLTYRSFTEAHTFVHTLGLKNSAQWYAYCRSGKKPPDIPSRPRQVYPSEYKDMGDWLGTTIIATSRRSYRSFAEARVFVQTQGLKDHDDWLNYCRSGKKPIYIPSKPEQVYRAEYKGMKDWLGVVDKWNSNTLLSFLHGLQPQLGQLTKKDLVRILQRNGALNPFRKVLGGATPIRVLNDLMKNAGRELEQALRDTLNGEAEALVESTVEEASANISAINPAVPKEVLPSHPVQNIASPLHVPTIAPQQPEKIQTQLPLLNDSVATTPPISKETLQSPLVQNTTPPHILQPSVPQPATPIGEENKAEFVPEDIETLRSLLDSTMLPIREKYLHISSGNEYVNVPVSSSSTRTKVFISYSHKDARYLHQLVEHSAYYERNNLIEFWSDEKITAGAQWRDEIKQAIEFTNIAVLLISPSFLASKFIAENELPPLLHAAEKEGAIILPVILRPSNFEDTALANFQAVNSPSMPVAKMKGFQRDELWAKVVGEIKKALITQQPQITTSNNRQDIAGQLGASILAQSTLMQDVLDDRHKRGTRDSVHKQIERSKEQVPLEKFAEYRPVLVPEGIPVFQDNKPQWLNWNINEQTLAIRNIGPGEAFNVASVIYGCESYLIDWVTNRRSNEANNIHWTCWLGVSIASQTTVKAIYKIGNGIFYEKNKHIGQYGFNAPPEPRVVPHQDQPFNIARIIIDAIPNVV